VAYEGLKIKVKNGYHTKIKEIAEPEPNVIDNNLAAFSNFSETKYF
jgi:hypothetical protein